MDAVQLKIFLDASRGVLRLTPTWVPRAFCRPGKRIKLHPDDYYALGAARGGIDERWFASTTHAENGPETPEDEGLSYIALNEDASERILLRDAVEVLQREQSPKPALPAAEEATPPFSSKPCSDILSPKDPVPLVEERVRSSRPPAKIATARVI